LHLTVKKINSQRKATVKIKYILLGIALSINSLFTFAQDNMTYVYQVVSDGEISDSVEWRVMHKEDIILLESTLLGTSYSYECNPDFTIRTMDMKQNNSDHLLFSDSGSEIFIRGKKDGDNINTKISKSKYPWYQNIGWAASNMLANGKDELTFSLIRPDNFSILNMQAKVMDEERIMYENGLHDVVKVKITLTGLLKHFWSGYYWYRKDDFKMVKYQGNSGPPGSPTLTMVLINEFVN